MPMDPMNPLGLMDLLGPVCPDRLDPMNPFYLPNPMRSVGSNRSAGCCIGLSMLYPINPL